MIFCARALRTKAIRNQQALLYKKKIFPKWLVGNAAIWVLILFHFITFVATRIRNLPQSTLTAPQICISTTAQDLSCCCWCTAAICHCNIKVHFLIARLTRSKDIGLAFLRAALLNARAQCRNRRRRRQALTSRPMRFQVKVSRRRKKRRTNARARNAKTGQGRIRCCCHTFILFKLTQLKPRCCAQLISRSVSRIQFHKPIRMQILA